MDTFIVAVGKCIVLCIYIAIATGTTTITPISNGMVSEPLNITCIVDPQNSAVTIKLPDGTSDASSCSAPLPNTFCSPIMPYTTVYTKDGTKVTFVLTIQSLNISIHNGTWTCTHGSEPSQGEVIVYARLFPQGKEPTVTATSAANTITVSGDAYCQHPVSSVTFEVLYAEQNGGFAMLNPQPTISRQYLGSNGCGSDEINVKFSGTVSCAKYGSLAGKQFTLMGRFNQPNLPPDINTYNVTKGSFSCPDVETTTAATTKGPGNGDGLSGGTIAGIVIAVIVIVCGIAVCCFCIFIKKDKDKKPKGRKSSTVGPIDTPENKNGKWVEPNAQTAGRYSANSVTSRTDVVVDVPESKTNQGDYLEKRITPRDLPPIPAKDQEEKPKIKKKKKKKKQANQEQNQQQQEGKDNTAFDNDQTENIPSDDTGNLETKTTPSNNNNVPSDDTGNLETKTTPSNNDNVPSDDLGSPETKTTPSNNDNTPSDDTGNPETKTTPSNNDSIPSDDLANLETNTSSNNDNIPSDDPANPEMTTPSNIDS